MLIKYSYNIFKNKNIVLIPSLVILIMIGTYFGVAEKTKAITLGSPHWVEKPALNLYYLMNNSYYDYDGNYVDIPPTCEKYPTINAYTNFYHAGDYMDLWSNSTCSGGSSKVYFNLKEAVCPTGEVMIGTRFYEFTDEIDDEHQDAYCAKISGVTLSTSRWVSAPNAYDKIRDYKYAKCDTGEIMTGVRMFGVYKHVDEEHIDVYCTKVTGITLDDSGGYWKVASPNPFTELYGGYKTATCSANQVMTGVAWYQGYDRVDDEHTDAWCVQEKPSVNIWFGSLILKNKTLI